LIRSDCIHFNGCETLRPIFDRFSSAIDHQKRLAMVSD
jgi:hypothetical protein